MRRTPQCRVASGWSRSRERPGTDPRHLVTHAAHPYPYLSDMRSGTGIRVGVVAAVLAVAGVVWVHTSGRAPFAGGTVVRVVDGDTIIVRGPGGRTEDVRLIGIDTPETVDPRRPVGCYGPEASAYAKHLLTGPHRDPALRPRDQRPLRAVPRIRLARRRRTPQFVNARLVELGYARAYPFPPNTAHEALFAALERQAAIGGQGLWGACG